MKYLYFLWMVWLSFGVLAQEEREQRPYTEDLLEDTLQIMALVRKTAQLSDSLNDQKLTQAEQVITSSLRLSFRRGAAFGYYIRAEIYFTFGSYDLALTDYQRFLDLDQLETTNPTLAPRAMFYIGKIHELRKYFSKALDYYQRAAEMASLRGDQRLYVALLGQMGNVYGIQGNLRQQIEMNLKTIALQEQMGDTLSLMFSYNDAASAYQQMEMYDSSIALLQKASQIGERYRQYEYLASGYANLAANFFYKNNYGIAKGYAEKAQELSQQTGSVRGAVESNYLLYQVYKAEGNFTQAIPYLEQVVILRDSMFNQDQTAAIQRLEANFTIKQKQQENEALQLENTLKAQQITTQQQRNQIAFAGLGILLTFIVGLVYARHTLKKSNQLLQTRSQELQIANQEISQQHKQITDSISYAQRIQNAILPDRQQMAAAFGVDNFFVLYQPKDIVSGDFFFFEQIQSPPSALGMVGGQHLPIQIVAVADCTGHGVPGAFMSMIANQLLYEIIIKDGVVQPNQVLQQLHTEIRRSLRQEQHAGKDGLDIALLVHQGNTLYFAGAHQPIYLISDGQLTRLKATRQSIGGYRSPEQITFTMQTYTITRRTQVYLSTDGYADQFGGPLKKKFLSKNLRQLLLQHADKPMQTQERILAQTIKAYRLAGNEKQIDDITVLGLILDPIPLT